MNQNGEVESITFQLPDDSRLWGIDEDDNLLNGNYAAIGGWKCVCNSKGGVSLFQLVVKWVVVQKVEINATDLQLHWEMYLTKCFSFKKETIIQETVH